MLAVRVDGLARALQGGDRQRPAADLGHRPQQGELGSRGRRSRRRPANTPLPVAPIAWAMPTSSSASAVRLGVMRAVGRLVVQRARGGEPEGAGLDALGRERGPCGDLVGGRAPRRARRRGRPSRRRAARRGAPGRRRRWRGAARRARRGTRGRSPSPRSRPSCSAVPGMSSTPSISSISQSWRSGRTGAKPTPQLPITTVVTPCQHDGRERSGPRWPGRRSGCGCRPSRA